MKRLAGTLFCASALLFCSTAPAVADDAVEVDWNRTPPASGRVVDDAAVVTAGDAGGTFPLVIIEDPPVDAPGYEVVGEVSYAGVEGRGYLEMWSVFADGSRYFSRTLGDAGPMATLTGTSGWRGFELPFELDDAAPPSRLEINVVLPGRGTVRVGPLHLVPLGQGAGTEGWWSDRAAGVAGAVGGPLLGLLGGLIGWLVSRGRARRFVLGTMVGLVVAGCALLATGVVAIALSQPYAVVFPLLLAGVLMIGVFGGNIRTARRAFAQAELRRMRAMDSA